MVDIAFSPPTEHSVFGENWKGGDQQEVRCNGLDGAAENGEVGENLVYSKTVQCAKELYSFPGISCGGNEKELMDLLTELEEKHGHEVLVSPSKPKGRRELKNLECSINFDARGVHSSRGKGMRVLSEQGVCSSRGKRKRVLSAS
jgi:hypothetical protein